MAGVAHGFVVQYGRTRGSEPHTPISLTHGPGCGTAVGRDVRVFARPYVTTPEAINERQPLVTPGVLLVYAGRIDNRSEIADRLGRPLLWQATDGDLLATAYSAWGLDFAAKIVGEYAVVLIDRSTGDLVAARDSLGINRLFRYDEAGSTWMASSLDLLLDALPRSPSLDRRSLIEYFAGGGLLSSGRTIYEGISEVPAAHLLVQRRGDTFIRRYWEPDPERRVHLRSDRDYDEALRALLFDATRAALRSSTRVWSDLSGGLDSSGVTAMATRLDQSGSGPSAGMSAFSLYTSEAAMDERAFQTAFITSYPLEHHTLNVDDHAAFSNTDVPPSGHPSRELLFYSLWSAAADMFDAHGVRTHLTGNGGDPVFCGDDFPPLYLADLLREGKWASWMQDVQQWAHLGRRSVANLFWHCSLNRLTDLYAGAEKLGDVPRWLAPGFRDEVRAAVTDPWRTGVRLFKSAARELQYRSITRTSSVIHFLLPGEERHPLLYRPLVEFALAIPWRHLQRPEQNRVIQRRALEGILPEVIRLRRTKAAGGDLIVRGFREAWPRIQSLVKARRVTELGLIEPDGFKAGCERLRHGVFGTHLRFYMAVLSLEMWLTANDVHRQRPLEALFSLPEAPIPGPSVGAQ